MNCPRCRGYMMQDDYLDLQDEAGQCRFVAWRCLICGEVLDPVILKHRNARPAPMVDRARPQLWRLVSIGSNRKSQDSPGLVKDLDGAELSLYARPSSRLRRPRNQVEDMNA